MSKKMRDFKISAIESYCKDCMTDCKRPMELKMELVHFGEPKSCRYKRKSRKVKTLIVSMLITLWISQAVAMDASYYSYKSLIEEGTWKNGIRKNMADGHPYNEHVLTCASWDYPLGTLVKVTNLENKKSVVVRVTDRTNRRYKGKRIDLSVAAMCAIDGLERRLVPCKVEVIK